MSPPTSRPLTCIGLGLEGTLIGGPVPILPRPGLASFCTALAKLADRVVWYSSMPPARVRAILDALRENESLPADAAGWPLAPAVDGKRDLRLLAGGEPLDRMLLIGEASATVSSGQESLWVPVIPWTPPYDPDEELARVLSVVQARAEQAAILRGVDAALGSLPDFPYLDT